MDNPYDQFIDGGTTATAEPPNPYDQFLTPSAQENPYDQFIDKAEISADAGPQPSAKEFLRNPAGTPVSEGPTIAAAVRDGGNVIYENGQVKQVIPATGEIPKVEGFANGIIDGIGLGAMRTVGGAATALGAKVFGQDLTAAANKYAETYSGDDVSTQTGRGIGTAIELMQGGIAGAVGQAGSQAFGASFAEDQDYGKATLAALKTAPEMAAYWLLGAGAAKSVEPLVKQAGPLIKAGAGALAATAANIVTGSVQRAYNAPAGERLEAAMPTAETLAMDGLFGFLHGYGEGVKASKSDATIREGLQKAPEEALRIAAADPEFRRTSPYNPKFIDDEIARRANIVPDKVAEDIAPEAPATAAALVETSVTPTDVAETLAPESEQAPSRLDQINNRLSEIESQFGPAERVNPETREKTSYRIFSNEEKALIQERDSLMDASTQDSPSKSFNEKVADELASNPDVIKALGRTPDEIKAATIAALESLAKKREAAEKTTVEQPEPKPLLTIDGEAGLKTAPEVEGDLIADSGITQKIETNAEKAPLPSPEEKTDPAPPVVPENGQSGERVGGGAEVQPGDSVVVPRGTSVKQSNTQESSAEGENGISRIVPIDETIPKNDIEAYAKSAGFTTGEPNPSGPPIREIETGKPDAEGPKEAPSPEEARAREQAHIRAYEYAEIVGNQVAKGQPDTVREAAVMAAYDNARRSIERGGKFNPVFMKRSAMTAAGVSAKKQPISIDQPTGDEEGSLTIGDRIADELQTSPEESAAENELIDRAKLLLLGLGDREAVIVRAHTMEQRTFAEIGEELGISRQAVEKIHAKAIAKMRKRMVEFEETGAEATKALTQEEQPDNRATNATVAQQPSDSGASPRTGLAGRSVAVEGTGATPEGRSGNQALPAGEESGGTGVVGETPLEANIGPGAANIDDPAFSQYKVTSVKNAQVDAERAARGELPLMAPARKAMGKTWDDAMAAVEKNPDLGRETVDRIRNGDKTDISETDQAILLHEKIRIHNEREMEGVRALDQYATEAERIEASLRFKELENRINEIDQATQLAGTISGRALQIRKQMMRDDYTPEAMERKARIAKGGEALTPEEVTAIKTKAEKITELETKIEEIQAKADAEAADKVADEAVKVLKKTGGKSALDDQGKLTEAIRKRAEDGDTPKDAAGLIQRLALFFVRSGVDKRDPLVTSVHDAIKDIFPGITREQTRDAISGYGDFKPLDKEPAKQTLRQLKGEMQQVGKIEDMLKKQAPKKTGVERRSPSDEERRLIKEVNELKKKGGFTVTDPAAQLKSALDSVKTRLKNQIRDIDTAIATRKPILQKKNGITYDAEATALQAQRNALKAQYDEIFGKPEMTEAQRLKIATTAAEKSLADWTARLESAKRGEFPTGEKAGKRATSAQLEALKARRDAAKAEVETLRDMDSALQEKAAVEGLEKSVAGLQERLAKGDVLPEPGKSTADSKRVAELKAKRDQLQRDLEAARKATPEAKQAALRKTEQSLKDSIAEYDRRLQEGDLASKGKPPQPDTPEIEALRAERNAMASLFRELQNAAKPKASPEEIALRAFKSRTATRIAELQDRIATGDFGPRPPKTEIKLDAEATRLKFEAEKVKRQFNEELFKYQLANRTFTKKVWDRGSEAINLTRAILTSFDLSAVLRQGGFVAVGNPVRAAKAIPDMFRALASKQKDFAINEEIRNRPNAPLYKQAKLYISDDGSSLSKMEEAYMSRYAEKIPIIAASQRAYTTFLNKLRADTFDALVKSLGNGGKVSLDEAKILANYVNVATGRGDLGKFQAAAVPMNTVFFAPRYVTSRFQLLLGQPAFKSGNTPATRKLIATEYAKYLAGVGTVLALASQLSDEPIELDPRSADFLKVRFGNTRMDVLSGLAQASVLTGRLATGETKQNTGKIIPIRGEGIPFGGSNSADVIARFLRSKLSPAVGASVDVLAGENIVGEKVTPAGAAARMVVPISFGDIAKAMEEQGIPKGTALSILSLFGASMQTYSDKPEETK